MFSSYTSFQLLCLVVNTNILLCHCINTILFNEMYSPSVLTIDWIYYGICEIWNLNFLKLFDKTAKNVDDIDSNRTSC